MTGEPLRLGIVGTDNTHAHTFAAFLNGWAEDAPIPYRMQRGVVMPDMYAWAATLRELEDRTPGRVPVPCARVTRIWSEDTADARRIAAACSIDRVCESFDEVSEGVDGVLVLSERPEDHPVHARPSLERGLPTFVDKPFAPDAGSARELFDLADRNGALCWTSSAKRFDSDIAELRRRGVERWGAIGAVRVVCPLSFELYGTHSLTMVDRLVDGLDPVRIEAIALPRRYLVGLEQRDGPTATLEHIELVTQPRYEATVYGPRGELLTTEANAVATNMLALVDAIVESFRTGAAPMSRADMLGLMDVYDAALRAGQSSAQV
jgi:hypothetical protein